MTTVTARDFENVSRRIQYALEESILFDCRVNVEFDGDEADMIVELSELDCEAHSTEKGVVFGTNENGDSFTLCIVGGNDD